jgi:hypothetical protein
MSVIWVEKGKFLLARRKVFRQRTCFSLSHTTSASFFFFTPAEGVFRNFFFPGHMID